ncbi:PAS domain-containing sensor histidine kinase [Flavobacterium anhuiense]|uniref:PAS domain-containing sensor histidine kinase n=2 Tax=Flavobacteriaceae TaxID=49546 RepID=UPI0016424CB1|nr:PAS domain-containing sensor histidine kinase [Flavobacterium anhuiense]
MRESVLRDVIDTAPFPIGLYTGYNMKIVLANKCMIKTYGKGPDVIGTNYTEILPELKNQEIFEQLREVLHTGRPFEAKNARVDIVVEGILKPHYFNYNFTPIFDVEGKVYGVMNTAAEVTELNVARQQTIEIEKRLRLAVDAAQLGTFEIDTDKGTITGSKRFLSFFEKDSEISLSDLNDLIYTEDLALWQDTLKNLTRMGDLNCEIRVAVNDTLYWLRFSGSLSESDNKENIIVGIAQDITQQKKNAQELLQLVEQRTMELTRSNDDLKQFGHVISHDLKEPVRKILLFSDILKQETAKGQMPRISQYANKLNKSAERLTEMIDSILNYSSAGSPEVEEEVDLNETIESIKEDLEIKILEKSAVIEHSKMPTVRGSKILFHQLFYNLIANSLKFSRENCDSRIKIQCSSDEGNLKITVSDNGIGIAPENSIKIFNAFERLHSKDQYEGTGLGLSLCKKITERHNGQLKNITVEGSGAVFEMTFPADILS